MAASMRWKKRRCYTGNGRNVFSFEKDYLEASRENAFTDWYRTIILSISASRKTTGGYNEEINELS